MNHDLEYLTDITAHDSQLVTHKYKYVNPSYLVHYLDTPLSHWLAIILMCVVKVRFGCRAKNNFVVSKVV